MTGSSPGPPEAAAVYGGDGAYDPEAIRSALARLPAPVLVLAGEVDLSSPPAATAEYVGLFHHAELVVRTGAGHHPWLDDPERFTAATAAFLRRPGWSRGGPAGQ